MEEIKKKNCEFCNHLQKIKNETVKCAVCLKKGFLNKSTDNMNKDETTPGHQINGIAG